MLNTVMRINRERCASLHRQHPNVNAPYRVKLIAAPLRLD